MAEELKIAEAVKEVQNANEEELRKVIEGWYERTRTDGLKIGAQMISAAVYGKIEKHLKKGSKPSLRDYQRLVDDILKIITVQLTRQNDSKEIETNDVTEDTTNDGTAE